MVVYPPASPSWVRLATLDDMYADDKGCKPKAKGAKFSHYRRSRVCKAPRKRTFIMHMTKYPDLWISALSSPTSSDSRSSALGGFVGNAGHNGAVQVAEPEFHSSDYESIFPSETAAAGAISVPPMKRRVSPFAVASAAAFQICGEDSSFKAVNDTVSINKDQAGTITTAATNQVDKEVEGVLPLLDLGNVSEQQLVLLGAGGQGSVYKGQLNGKTVAFKFPTVQGKEEEDGSSNSSFKSFEREVAVLTMYQHPNIVPCFGVWRQGPRPCFVEEYAERGSLHDWLYTTDVQMKAETLAVLVTRAISQHYSGAADLVEPLSALTLQTATAATHGTALKWQEWSASNVLKYIAILQALLDISSALSYLHSASPKVVHRDLKPDNVLLTSNGVAKLADFGVAKILRDQTVEPRYELFGTANYAAPEDLWGSPENVGPAADVYSLGCIAWECFAGERPWMGCSEYSIMFSVGQGMKHLPLPDSWPSGLKELLSKCLAFDASVRPDGAEVCSTLTAELVWATDLLVATLRA